MTLPQYLLGASSGLSLAAGQILFKIAANQTTLGGDKLPMLSTLFSLPMVAACMLYAITVVLYVYLLRQVPLSQAYMFSLAGSVLVIGAAIVFFGEEFSLRYALGATMVLFGIVLSTTA